MTAPHRSADLRQRLVSAGLDELRENGLAAVSIRAVARRTGVSHAAPGYVFGDRAGLLTSMAERGFELLRDHLVASSAGAGGEEAVIAVGAAYLEFARQQPALYQLLFDADELRRDDPGLATAGAEAFGALIDRLPPAVAATAPRGAGPLLAWAVVHGLAGLERSGALGAGFADDSERAHAEHALLRHVAPAISAQGEAPSPASA